jgi:phenylpyruvate tautomerase PptA (4-oxalocrotonate tautomerase family)
LRIYNDPEENQAMPIIDFSFPSGSLNEAQQDELARELSNSLKKCAHAIDNPRADAINWLYLHELPANRVYVAGQIRPKPHYRIEVMIMEGMMTQEIKEQIAEDMTLKVLKAEASAFNAMNASRVWVIFHDVPDGNWASGGRLYGLQDLMSYIEGRK